MKPVDPTYSIRAQDSIAQGALTNSKRPESFVKGVYHTHATHGFGPFIYDAGGRKLTDFICGLGSNILGYGNHEIAQSIYDRAIKGTTLSLSSVIELELAEKIKEVVPWIQKMRFLKSGTEACMAAVRIARAKTGRQVVLSEGYHGHLDEFIALTPPAHGVHSGSHVAPLKGGDLGEDVAAVIIEPIMTDISQIRIERLRRLREQCTKVGAVLIFDEIITGFRTPKFTMSSYFGIEPDLICLGKAMANGMPISVVAGKDDVMNCEDEYFVSSTFAGETCSAAAALKCIQLLQTQKFNLQDLWDAGEHFISRFNTLYPEKIKITGYPTRGVFEGDPLVKALLWQEAYLADILFGASFFINFAHIPYLDRTYSVLKDITLRIKTGSVELIGEMPKTPFAQKIRGSSNDRARNETGSGIQASL